MCYASAHLPSPEGIELPEPNISCKGIEHPYLLPTSDTPTFSGEIGRGEYKPTWTVTLAQNFSPFFPEH